MGTTLAPRSAAGVAAGVGTSQNDRADPGTTSGAEPLPRWVVVALALVCVLAGTLRLWAFGRVAGTPFYDAAVRSMGLSWHNLFYGAIEPGGQVAIDKTPVDLWLQVASTKLLGFSNVTLRLPEAVAGIVAVPLLFDVVRRGFGSRAGLCAALALAVLPVSVLTSRSDTMDTLMGTLLLAAVWVVVRARPERRARGVVVAGAVAGLAFEVKLFQAGIGLPAIAVLALLAVPGTLASRMRAVAAGGLAFVAVAAAWPVAASVLPGTRPFPLGSTDGSIASVLLGYNGVSRIGAPTSGSTVSNLTSLVTGGGARHLAGLVGVELGAALVLGGLAVVAIAPGTVAGLRAIPAALRARLGVATTGSTRGDEATLRLAVGAALATWLITGTAVLSVIGQMRPRYLEAFSPAVSGTIGVAVVVLGGAAAHRRRAWLLPAGAVAVLLVPFALRAVSGAGGSATAGAGAVALLVSAAALAPGWTPSGRPVAAGVAVVLLIGAVTVGPFVTSARLASAGAGDSGTAGRLAPSAVTRLANYLSAHQSGVRYQTASSGITPVAPLIVRDGRPVLVLGSIGARPLVSLPRLRASIRAGEVRYLLSGSGPARLLTVRWVQKHGTDVSARVGLPRGIRLYRVPGA